MVALLYGTELSKVRISLESKLKNDEIKPIEQYSRIVENPELNLAVNTIISHFGTISIAIQKGYADEDTLYRKLDTYLPKFTTDLAPYIDGVREYRKDNRVHQEAQRLAAAWNSRIYLSSNTPIKSLYTNQIQPTKK